MSTQISAHISDETKAQLEAFVTSRGVTRARLIEDALLHHLQALREIPDDLIVPSRLLVSETTLERLAGLVESDAPPTPALRELMHSGRT
jgi:hypothetical protein